MKDQTETNGLLQQLTEIGLLTVRQRRKYEALGLTTRQLTLRLVADRRITQWQAERLFERNAELTLGKYVLQDELAPSSNDAIYIAKHPQMRRRVAIKLFAAADPRDRRILLSNIGFVAALNHSHLIHIFDVDHQEDRVFVVMELVQGVDLQRRMAHGATVSISEAVQYVKQAAAAMAYAHDNGCVHGSLTAGKLLVGDDGAVKVLGVRRASSHDQDDAPGSRLKTSCSFVSVPPPSAARRAAERSAEGDNKNRQLVVGQVPSAEPANAAEVSRDIGGLGRILGELLQSKVDVQSRPCPEHGELTDAQLRELRQVVRRMRGDAADQWSSMHEVAAQLERFAPHNTRPVLSTDQFSEVDQLPSPGGRNAGMSIADHQGATTNRRRTVLLAGMAAAALLICGLIWHHWPTGTEIHSNAAQTSAETRDSRHNVPASRPLPTPSLKESGNIESIESEPNELAVGAVKESTQPTSPPSDDLQAADAQSSDHPDMPQQPADVGAKNTGDQLQDPQSTDEVVATPETDQDGSRDSFTQLPTACDLPIAGQESAVTVIGSFAGRSLSDCELELIGAQNALLGQHAFSTRRHDHGWQVVLDIADKTDVPVADFSVHDETLVFQWLDIAPFTMDANHLRNCLLLLRCGDKEHVLRLRTPRHVDPLVVDLQAGRLRRSLELLWPPRAETIWLQVHVELPDSVEPSGQLDRTVRGDSPMPPLQLDAEGRLQLAYRLELGRQSQLVVLPMYQAAADGDVRRITRSTVRQLESAARQAQVTSAQLKVQLEQLQKGPLYERMSESQQKAITAQHESRISHAKQLAVRIDQFLALCREVDDRAIVHFRLLQRLDEFEIELVTTQPAAEGTE